MWGVTKIVHTYGKKQGGDSNSCDKLLKKNTRTGKTFPDITVAILT